MTDALQMKLDAVFAQDEFKKQAADVTSLDELFSLLHDNGVDLDDDDIEYCVEKAEQQMIKTGYMSEEGELSEELLEMVSGGGLGASIGRIIGGGAFVGMGAAYIGAAKAGIAGYSACMAIGGACCMVGAALIVAGVVGVGIYVYKKKQKKRY